MTITFCGHSNCLFSDEEKDELKQLIIKEVEAYAKKMKGNK